MDWLNYHHMYYFWMVAREGTVVGAAKRLRLAQPSVSAQIRSFEKMLGYKLFEKVGRNLKLTDSGEVVFGYADEIFSLGKEMLDTLNGRAIDSRVTLRVGIADMLPKLVVSGLLRPAIDATNNIHLTAFDGKTKDMLSQLSVHGLDMVLTDTPLSPDLKIKAFNHLLGECPVALYAEPSMAKKFRRNFPQSLKEAPMLLPTITTTLRRSIDLWFEENSLSPVVVGEYEDSALLKIFGQEGLGVFPLPTVIEKTASKQFNIKPIGVLDGVVERFYAISPERKIQHPGVKAITSAARDKMFGSVVR